MNRYSHNGSATIQGSFGQLIGVFPMSHVRGEGHDERIDAQFTCPNGGKFHLELTRAAALLVAQELLDAAMKLPVAPDVSGALADLEEK
ncbi:hypothetical protein I5I01_gp54 [Mycobacterium phage MooMoo]|uniref:Uncharacterized protein n=1 Tax=Mycobacterium phage MooMoo TaxID=2108127 RepID=A0A2P1JR88_9CAUD|nr:hypothetical protein I5I01_gp54 [Mycobacterium phage MooMoo]AVO21659.1 hypothetical protein SEA_MOOMOO_54 [Mycobacterium phage MooMoo]